MMKSQIFTLSLLRSLLAVTLLAVVPARAEVPPETLFFQNLQAGKKQTVVIYGTSLSKGGAWAMATKEWFESRYPGLVTFINSSGSGKNSDWALENLKAKVLAHRPNLILMEFSYNDCVDRFDMPVERAAANLEKMIAAIREQDPTTAIVLQVMNVGWDAPNGNKSFSVRLRLEEFNNNYRAAAKAHNLTLLDHYPNWLRLKETDPEKFQSYIHDGSHPVREGSMAITWPTVKAWLEQSR